MRTVAQRQEQVSEQGHAHPLQWTLPEERHEAEARVETVFGIAGQFLPKNLFLIEQANNDEWDKQGKDGQGEVRTERQRRK